MSSEPAENVVEVEFDLPDIPTKSTFQLRSHEIPTNRSLRNFQWIKFNGAGQVFGIHDDPIVLKKKPCKACFGTGKDTDGSTHEACHGTGLVDATDPSVRRKNIIQAVVVELE